MKLSDEKTNNETSRPAKKERPFLRFLRYAAVAVVSLDLDDEIGNRTLNKKTPDFTFLLGCKIGCLFYKTLIFNGLLRCVRDSNP